VNAKAFTDQRSPSKGDIDDMGLDNPIHIAFLLILLLLVFGAKRLPEMGRSLGSGMRGFKDALSGESGVSGVLDAAPSTPAMAPAPAAPEVAPPVEPESTGR
jgi:sec-independent protein translocase protein TatA